MPKQYKLAKIIVFLSLLAVVLYNRNSIAGAFSRWSSFSFCDKPVAYRIGTVDSRFGISSDDFTKLTAKAVSMWNDSYDKTLFVYDPNGDLEVSLIYDGRQQMVNNITGLQGEVEKQKSAILSQSEKYEQLKASIEKSVEELNKEIDYWNSRGGAPREIYEELVKKQREVVSQSEELQRLAKELNKGVDQVNTQVSNLNSKVDSFNSVLKLYPEAGLYSSGGNKIEVFFYDSEAELIHILAHEFGHALGLKHVESGTSIMSPVADATLGLSPQDKEILGNYCTERNRVELIKNDLNNFATIFLTQIKEMLGQYI